MAGLLGLLDMGAATMTAEHAAIASAGRNVANANTDGYQRETLDLQAEIGAPLLGGVRAGDLSRASDDLLSRRERSAAGSFGSSASQAAALSHLEQRLGEANLVQSVSSLFGRFVDLAAAPLDDARRGAVLGAADQLAKTFRAASATLDEARAGANGRIATLASTANDLAAKIAGANRALATERDPALADERDLAAKQLAELVGGEARVDPDGRMRVVVGAGTVLVDGDRAATLTTSPDAAARGDLRVAVVDGARSIDVTATLDGGRIAGELAFRDGDTARASADLDALATTIITRVNSIHAGGAGRDGVSGRNLFVAGGTPPAATFAVDPAVAGKPAAVAAGAAGAGVGDNRAAMALVALRDQTVAAGGTRTIADEAIHTLSSVGATTASVTAARDLSQARVTSLRAARDSVSGVSTEEELSRLAQLQHAAEAAQKFVSVVDQLLGELVQKI